MTPHRIDVDGVTQITVDTRAPEMPYMIALNVYMADCAVWIDLSSQVARELARALEAAADAVPEPRRVGPATEVLS